MLECDVTMSEAASRPIQQTEPFLRDFKHLAITERVKINKCTPTFKQMGDTQMAESIFQEVETAPPDPVFGVLARFKDDKTPQKVNLSVGGMKYKYISSGTLNITSFILVKYASHTPQDCD